MTSDELLAMFERAHIESRPFDLDEIVAGFAGWLAQRWDSLSN
jgi:hypothetical protein